jgi:uncharacterized protein YqfA (UPF0365 family)
MADALRSGRMGVMDLYRMKNIEADTSMRQQLGGGPRDAEGDKGR